MTKTELKKIMKDNMILECDIEDAIEFVRDLLEFRVKETEEYAPWAWRSIESDRNAARAVGDLLEYIEECEG